MEAQHKQPVVLILVLALIVSLFVSPAAGAPPAGVADKTVLAAPTFALAPGNMEVTPPLQDIAGIAAGGTHNCAITNSGGVKCWGTNWFGQLSDGGVWLHPVPVDVIGLSNGVVAVVGGIGHTCALTTGGGVKCWGQNFVGQLGDGTSTARLAPEDVASLGSGVKDLAAGSAHTCALTDAGAVKCWGSNFSGQLGDGTTTDRTTPVDVAGLGSGVKALALGMQHSCALTDGGRVKCWGNNSVGQLGDGTTTNRNAPGDVSGLTGVSSLAGGATHTCALTTGGGVKCWGYGGDGTTEARLTPFDVAGLGSGVKALEAGSGHTCVVTSDGGVECWGWNTFGQLGDGTTTDRTTPVDVASLGSGVKALALGLEHSCALTDAGMVKCWGNNRSAQLGVKWTSSRALPADVAGLTSGVAALSDGGGQTCALTGTGALKCWGFNGSGQVGDGTTTYRGAPVDVTGLSNGAAVVSAGGVHTCAVTSGGGLKCWGNNNAGQLGDGTQGTDRKTPVNVVDLGSGVAAVSASQGTHTCALTTAGAVKCWGRGNFGQLGDGANLVRKTPVDVVGLSSGVKAVTTGRYHTCAITGSGGVRCWGDNSFGQLGDGTTTRGTTPVDVVGLSSGVAAIAAGSGHTCALTGAGGVKCWGDNVFGQLGDGTTTQRLTPVDVTGLTSGVTALASGYMHMCALTSSGGVKCWGAGQLGDGTVTVHLTPVDVVGLASGVKALAAGTHHTCALVGEGRPKCWGDDGSHQLNQFSLAVSTTPVDVMAAEPSPELVVNYASGKPGSFFTLTGANFPASVSLTIVVNGLALVTTAMTTETGDFIVFLDSTGADAGFYTVEVSAGAGESAVTGFVLDPNAPLQVQEGGGTTYSVPAGIAAPNIPLYMPLMLHEP